MSRNQSSIRFLPKYGLRTSPHPAWASAIVPQETGRVLADLGLHRWTDSTRWVLARSPWHGRTFSVFLLAVHHFTRLDLL
jgi:hypothetical protein